MVYIDWSDAQKKRTPAEKKARMIATINKINATERNAKYIASHPTKFSKNMVNKANKTITTGSYSDKGIPKNTSLRSSSSFLQQQNKTINNKLLNVGTLNTNKKLNTYDNPLFPDKNYVNPLVPKQRDLSKEDPRLQTKSQIVKAYEGFLGDLEKSQQVHEDDRISRSFFRTSRIIFGIPKDVPEVLENSARGLYYLSQYVTQGRAGEGAKELEKVTKGRTSDFINNAIKHPEDILADAILFLLGGKVMKGKSVPVKTRAVMGKIKVSTKAPKIYQGIVNKMIKLEKPKFSTAEKTWWRNYEGKFSNEVIKNQGKINKILEESNLGKYMERDYVEFISDKKINLKPSRQNLLKEMQKQKMSENKFFTLEKTRKGEPVIEFKTINEMTKGELDYMTKVLKKANDEGIIFKSIEKPLKKVKQLSEKQIKEQTNKFKLEKQEVIKKWNEKVKETRKYENELLKKAKQQKGLEKTKTIEAIRKQRKQELNLIKEVFKDDIKNGEIVLKDGYKFKFKNIGKLTDSDIATLLKQAGKTKSGKYLLERKKITQEIKADYKKEIVNLKKKPTTKPTKNTGYKEVETGKGMKQLTKTEVKPTAKLSKTLTEQIKKLELTKTKVLKPVRGFNPLLLTATGSILASAYIRDSGKQNIQLIGDTLVPVIDLRKDQEFFEEDLTEKEELTRFEEIVEQAKQIGITLATIGAIALLPRGGAKMGGSVEGSGGSYSGGYRQLKTLPKKYQVSLGGLVLGKKTTSIPMEVSGTGIRPLLVRKLQVKKAVVRKKVKKRKVVKKKKSRKTIKRKTKKRVVKRIKVIKRRIKKKKVKRKTSKKRVVKKRKTKRKTKKRRK